MSDQKREFYQPTEDELRARNKRNIAIGLACAVFMLLAFVTMITRSGAFS